MGWLQCSQPCEICYLVQKHNQHPHEERCIVFGCYCKVLNTICDECTFLSTMRSMASSGHVKIGVFLLIPGSTGLISFRLEVRKAAAERSGSRGNFPSWVPFCPRPHQLSLLHLLLQDCEISSNKQQLAARRFYLQKTFRFHNSSSALKWQKKCMVQCTKQSHKQRLSSDVQSCLSSCHVNAIFWEVFLFCLDV